MIFLKAFSEAAKLYGEDKLREGGVGEGRQTPVELDAEITRVREQLLTLPPYDARRKALMQRSESLYKQRYGAK